MNYNQIENYNIFYLMLFSAPISINIIKDVFYKEPLDLILLDEPLANLDFKLREEFGQTFVLVTHNNELAEMADRKLEMKDGKII